jgi:hypothetical protein
MTALGQRTWVVPAGWIPAGSTGHEPDFTSRDEVVILNTGETDATVSLTVYYAHRDPVTGYEFDVAARRVRRVRVNDLIDPEAVPLEVMYAVVLEASVPVVVERIHVDTRQAENAMFGGVAYAAG